MADKTNAERLDALLAKHAPKAVGYLKTHGSWPRPDNAVDTPKDAVAKHTSKLIKNDGMSEKAARALAESTDAARRGAPYKIDTVAEGSRVSITKDDGSVVAGTGATIADALSQLEKG